MPSNQTQDQIQDQEQAAQEQQAHEVEQNTVDTQEENQGQETPSEPQEPKQETAAEQLQVKEPKVQTTSAPAVSAESVKVVVQETQADQTFDQSVFDIAHEDFKKFMTHFDANTSAQTKAWAKVFMANAFKYRKNARIGSETEMVSYTRNMLAYMTQAASGEDFNIKLRFVMACFKYIPKAFDLVLLNRAANQLAEDAFKKYAALTMLFHYWADYGSATEIQKRMNVKKSLSDAFTDPVTVQVICSAIGIK